MQQYSTDQNEFWRVLGGSARSQAALMTLEPGKDTGGPDNRHARSDQWLYVISGKGEAFVSGETLDLKEGMLVLIEAGEAHQIRNTGDKPLRTLDFYAPPEY
ncbi:MAG: cupin domain-containing protein [Candidatus Omnitrophica bacterium]|nr:cupin domain-containing protein [Candidatus Omnitrophota bacterium]